MADSFAMLQSERSQSRASGFVICVKNAPNPQTLRDLDEQRRVFDIEYLSDGRLGNVQSQPIDVRVGLAKVDKAGGNKSIHKLVQFELANPIRIQFARFVADHDNLQSVFGFQVANQFNHPGVRFRLRKHEAPEFSAGKWPFLVEEHPV
jgi:hypothetical protein